MNSDMTSLDNTTKEEEVGKQKLEDSFNIWSAGLSRHSVQAIYAIIAANWATHVKPTNPILSDKLAVWSMAFCIAFIMVNIFITGKLTKLHKDQWQEAEDNTESWKRDFRNRNDKNSEWPFTKEIECYGIALHYLRIFVPLIAGSLFLISLFL